jgi:peptidoglycan/xylan/chitin deacetylase (PgdA/CDA1 family)
VSRWRWRAKAALAAIPDRRPPRGATLLIWHRVGGGSGDELDVDVDAFERQLDIVAEHDVVGLDEALDRLDAGDDRPTVVLTFDDGFSEVHDVAFPRLAARGLPFTVYLAAGLAGRPLRWEGATARGTGTGLGWDELRELVDSGLCTVGNHTLLHTRPELLDERAVDDCTAVIEEHLHLAPRHFAFPWGVPVPAMRGALAARFRSAATGRPGRNLPGGDPMALCRVPVRRTDPPSFVAAKLRGALRAERAYVGAVSAVRQLSRAG